MEKKSGILKKIGAPSPGHTGFYLVHFSAFVVPLLYQ